MREKHFIYAQAVSLLALRNVRKVFVTKVFPIVNYVDNIWS